MPGVHHYRQDPGQLPVRLHQVTLAEQVLSEQGGVGLHPQGHVAVYGGMEREGEENGGSRRCYAVGVTAFMNTEGRK